MCLTETGLKDFLMDELSDSHVFLSSDLTGKGSATLISTEKFVVTFYKAEAFSEA